jgi:predicted phage tail protein
VFFDIVTNDRFGLGHRVPLDWVDKWRLYQIARYCDELVSDGQGGKEPRFTCSLYLQTRAEAYRVLQDIATMFRGISFYAAGQVMASADMPKDPVLTYSQANVIEGRFHYAGSSRRRGTRWRWCRGSIRTTSAGRRSKWYSTLAWPATASTRPK